MLIPAYTVRGGCGYRHLSAALGQLAHGSSSLSRIRCLHANHHQELKVDDIRNIGIIAHVDAVWGETDRFIGHSCRRLLTQLSSGQDDHYGADALLQWSNEASGKYALFSPPLGASGRYGVVVNWI